MAEHPLRPARMSDPPAAGGRAGRRGVSMRAVACAGDAVRRSGRVTGPPSTLQTPWHKRSRADCTPSQPNPATSAAGGPDIGYWRRPIRCSNTCCVCAWTATVQPLFEDAVDTAAADIARLPGRATWPDGRAAGPHADDARPSRMDLLLRGVSRPIQRPVATTSGCVLHASGIGVVCGTQHRRACCAPSWHSRTAWPTARHGTRSGRRPAHAHVSAVGHPTASFVRVLDPAMGTGVFLLAAFDHIRHWWAANRATQTADAIGANSSPARCFRGCADRN